MKRASAMIFTLTSTVMLAGLACTQTSSEEKLKESTAAALAQACEGYKPHVDGVVGSWDTNNHCGTCVQHGRLARTTPERSSTCEAHTAPGVVDEGNLFHFDRWQYKNRQPTSSCIEVIVTQYTGRSTFTGFRAAAYLGAFDPNAIQRNYLGDSGNVDVPEHRFKFTVAPLADFEVVLTGADTLSPAAETGAMYRLDVVGCGQLVVTSVTPSCGSPAGGTKVTIRGSGFGLGSSIHEVKIGSLLHDITPIDDDTFTAVTSATAAGTYDATVTMLNYGPPTFTLPRAFTYADDCGGGPPPPPPPPPDDDDEAGSGGGKTW